MSGLGCDVAISPESEFLRKVVDGVAISPEFLRKVVGSLIQLIGIGYSYAGGRCVLIIWLLYVIGPGDKIPGKNETFHRQNVESMDFH